MQLHLGFVESLNQFNAQGLQLLAHGGVHPGVATCDLMSGLSCQGGQTSHEGAANSQYVDVHGTIVEGALGDLLVYVWLKN